MKTIADVFDALHLMDHDLAHQFLVLVIQKYGRHDPRVVEIFNPRAVRTS